MEGRVPVIDAEPDTLPVGMERCKGRGEEFIAGGVEAVRQQPVARDAPHGEKVVLLAAEEGAAAMEGRQVGEECPHIDRHRVERGRETNISGSKVVASVVDEPGAQQLHRKVAGRGTFQVITAECDSEAWRHKHPGMQRDVRPEFQQALGCGGRITNQGIERRHSSKASPLELEGGINTKGLQDSERRGRVSIGRRVRDGQPEGRGWGVGECWDTRRKFNQATNRAPDRLVVGAAPQHIR